MSDAQREVDLRRAISHNQYTKLELTWHGIALHLLHEDFQGETLERLLKRDFRGEALQRRLRGGKNKYQRPADSGARAFAGGPVTLSRPSSNSTRRNQILIRSSYVVEICD
jgi:hypothetical protein